MQHSETLAELNQNWFGIWQFKHNATLITTTYPQIVEDQITWSASGKSKENAAFYFGIVTDPEIDYITIETQDDFLESVQLIREGDLRFFFKRGEGPLVFPVNISGYSQSGELIYSSLKGLVNYQSEG